MSAKPQQYSAKLAERVELNEKYHQFSVELLEPSHLLFEAGQYVSIAINEAGERRSYSITSKPSVQHGFELLIDVEPAGPGSHFMRSAQIGQELRLLAPLGRFTLGPAEEEPNLVFVATGSGIAPFRSMLLHLLQDEGDQRRIQLLWGMRHDAQLFWLEEFELLMEAFPNFRVMPVISQPSQAWNLDQGRVTDALQVHGVDSAAHYYLCGNGQMIADVQALLQAQGLGDEQIHFEKFY